MKVKKYMLFAVIVLSVYGNCQSFDSIIVDFSRKIIENSSEDVVEGSIYYKADKSVFKILNPINQWMIIENNTLLIYYPDEAKAIKITYENPVTLPFFWTFIGLTDENLGLTKAGFTLVNSQINGDSLFIFWQPPEILAESLGEHIIVLKDDKIILSEQKDNEGTLLTRTIFSNYYEHNYHSFPLEIVSQAFLGNQFREESMAYSNPEFDVELPDEIMDFQLPDDTEINEIDW